MDHVAFPCGELPIMKIGAPLSFSFRIYLGFFYSWVRYRHARSPRKGVHKGKRRICGRCIHVCPSFPFGGAKNCHSGHICFLCWRDGDTGKPKPCRVPYQSRAELSIPSGSPSALVQPPLETINSEMTRARESTHKVLDRQQTFQNWARFARYVSPFW